METARSKVNYQYLFRNSPKGLLAIIDGCRDAIFITSADSSFVEVNKAAEELTGYMREELLNMRIPDLHDDVDRAAYNEYFNRILKGEEVTSEAVVRRKDGNYVDTEFSNRRICVQGIYFMHSIARDVTERKRKFELIRKNEQVLRMIIENSLEGINVLDLKAQKYFLMSPSQIKMTGFSREEILNITAEEAFERVHPEDRMISIEQQRRIAEGDETLQTVEYRWKVKSGEYRWFSDSRSVMRNQDGEPIFLLGISRDITESKKSEDALRQSKEMLELLNQRLSDISEKERAAISREIHDDLGQSLTALKLELNKIHHHLINNPSALTDLARINSLVTGTIRDVQRISTELRSGILDDLGLQAAFEWYTSEFERRSNIKCQLEITHSDIKNPALNLALYRILQESLTNVIRHSLATEVKVAVKRTSKRITMKIVDNGLGIPEEKIVSPGSLGIVSMRERVRQFHGIIDFKSSRGKGTVVSILIPLESRYNEHTTS